MPRDHLATLGLQPGRYSTQDIERRFQALRSATLAALRDPATHEAARRRLDALHVARAAVLASDANTPQSSGHAADSNAAAELRRLIAASLEDGLLRCTRRSTILAEGRRLGFSDFHVQLLIAEVQFRGRAVLAPPLERRRQQAGALRIGARAAAAGVLALALFLSMIRWLHV
ncbi:MAG: hypothetical protein HRF50_14300 [Phycisphaerae bacterium]|jgi:hypothetical protein